MLQIGLPLFFLLFSLVAPSINRTAINVRRALKRYDEQLTYPAPTALTKEEKQAELKGAFRKQLARARYGVVAYMIVMLFITTTSNNSFRRDFGKYSPSVILGIFLSGARPFSVLTREKQTSYVRRLKNKRAGIRTTMVELVEIPTTGPSKVPMITQRIGKILSPVVLGFVAAKTGILLPFIWTFHKSVRLAPFLPQGASVKMIFLIMYGMLALVVMALAAVVALVIRFHPGTSAGKDSADTDHRKESSDMFALVYSSFSIVGTMIPVYCILAAARNYDLHNLEKSGDLETDILLLRDSLPEDEAQEEKAPVSTVKLDENGKRPEIVDDANALNVYVCTGPAPFEVFIGRGPRNPKWLHKPSVLRLPTFASAVGVLQATALLMILGAFLVSQGRTKNPNMAWLHPISLGDLFGEEVLVRGEALATLAIMSFLWSVFMVGVLALTILISALRQHGFEGVKAAWTYQDQIWFEGPASTVLAPETEGGEDVTHPDQSPLVDVSC
ncbi:hypothetical protein OC846_005473 [Tilletia horrida]|uniref:Uncharacterized protein n=1 Tax=Tilletia horrida TaxID=155126 RepID=A0AAN6JQ73_9BASI|nr:hypothetical protein OC846_005473 [Tilletia horrida]